MAHDAEAKSVLLGSILLSDDQIDALNKYRHSSGFSPPPSHKMACQYLIWRALDDMIVKDDDE